jgi:hypothetical protein
MAGPSADDRRHEPRNRLAHGPGGAVSKARFHFARPEGLGLGGRARVACVAQDGGMMGAAMVYTIKTPALAKVAEASLLAMKFARGQEGGPTAKEIERINKLTGKVTKYTSDSLKVRLGKTLTKPLPPAEEVKAWLEEVDAFNAKYGGRP